MIIIFLPVFLLFFLESKKIVVLDQKERSLAKPELLNFSCDKR